MINFSAPQKFRVIDSKDGEIIIRPIFICYDGSLSIYFKENGCMKPTPKNYIASAAIGFTDSKKVEIYAGDSGLDNTGTRWFIRWCNSNSKYIGHRMYKTGDSMTTNISTLLNREFIIDSNIWIPKYEDYVKQFKD